MKGHPRATTTLAAAFAFVWAACGGNVVLDTGDAGPGTGGATSGCGSDGGICVMPVNPCMDNAGCSMGETCDTSTGFCVPAPSACSSDADCPAGEMCDMASCSNLCVVPGPACQSETDCAPGMTCDFGVNMCVPTCNGGCMGPGFACQTDSDCCSLVCTGGACQ